ncbi:glutathione S-transferase family protein [Oceanibacterium hippocampi]|uniref:Glutathione S-transferase GST-6.0 n=1 Tax=Oceanibacterium hippocampi TaxID=745714 RepID=A0A1Y5T5S3_9PROT|nr:glutathione S-transferase family protein [Oceanibacterium hippocampi]SLN56407.1 Glutathione S-transferase GST-6.0 [Oceanibacterium hippocampi]
MIRLHEFPPTRSIRARWTLQELEAEFESVIVNMRAGAHRQPDFLALNPAGKLPVLEDDGVVLTESVAIVLYLCEKFPDRGLMPAALADRGQALRWLMFTATELEQPLWRIARHSSLYPEAERLPADIALARRDFEAMATVLEDHLRGRDQLVGDDFSAADIVCAYTLDWANEVGLLERFPVSLAYMEQQYRRPCAAPRIREARAMLQQAG